MSPGTIRHILRRNRGRLKYSLPSHRTRKEKREFVGWYSAKPFEIVQMDIKHIRDQKALTGEQIIHLDRYQIPNYQWGALDVNSRFKLIGYSREKSWTNGLCWYLWVISWLRSHGVKSQIVFAVDNGEEFYIPRVLQIESEADLLNEAMGYIYYYDNVRGYYSLSYQIPFAYLKSQLPDLDDKIRFVIPIMLDKVSAELGPWSGYHILAQYLLYQHLSREYDLTPAQGNIWLIFSQIIWLTFALGRVASTTSHLPGSSLAI